jgi:hypothetical protein
LVERPLCMRKVRGSIPRSSIFWPPKLQKLHLLAPEAPSFGKPFVAFFGFYCCDVVLLLVGRQGVARFGFN